MLIILTPSDLKHPLEGFYRKQVLLLLLVHLSNLFIYKNCFLIVICIFNQVSEKFKHLTSLLWLIDFLQEKNEEHTMLYIDYKLIEKIHDCHICVYSHESLLPVLFQNIEIDSI